MKEIKIHVFGRVQGVNFRRNTVKKANDLNVKGYVQNLSDGSLKIVAKGGEPDLLSLLNWVQSSPFPSKVTGMNFNWIEDEEVEDNFEDFHIKKTEENFILDEAKSLVNLGKNVIHPEKINVPKHVVIIPDGNRRWARKNKLKAWVGHKAGADLERLFKLFYECKDLGINYVSFWAFSTENWKRDDKEVEKLFEIFRKGFPKMKAMLLKEKIKFKHLGRKDRLPKDILDILDDLEESSNGFKGLNLQMCIDYNGRDDIVRAYRKMTEEGVRHVDEETVKKYLDTGGEIPDPDLIIRTAGEKRTSGIMAYQAAYSELYFTDALFPDFDGNEFRRAILDYSARTRRFGGTSQNDLSKVKEEDLREVTDSELKKMRLKNLSH